MSKFSKVRGLILSILRWLWPAAAAALEAYWAKDAQEQEEAQAELVQEVQDEIAAVDSQTDAERLNHVIELGLVWPPDSGRSEDSGDSGGG